MALLAIGAAIAVGGRAWHQFSSNDVRPPSSPQEHLTQLSGSGRNEFWRVAIDAFDEKPLLGHGAGTYRISWHQLRHDSVANLDAHSLYLQAFAELGVVGGLLVLAMVGTLLWTGVAAWRAARGPRRDLYAALLGAALAFAICSAIDWFWQIAAMGAVFFLATGVLVAARCAQLARSAPPGRDSAGAAPLPAGDRRARDRVDRGGGAGRSAAGRPRDRRQQLGGGRRQPGERRQRRRSGALDRALGDLALQAARPAGGARRATTRPPSRGSTRGSNGKKKAGSSTTCGRESSTRPATKRRRRANRREAQRLNPEEKCLHEGFEGCE